MYTQFLTKKINTGALEYLDYPELYKKLTNEQKKEVDTYKTESKSVPIIIPDIYQYVPSNHYMDEIKAHVSTLEASKLGCFTMSPEKESFYNDEIQRCEKLHKEAIEFENKNGYKPDGTKK